MRVLGQPVVLLAVAALIWLLAVAHPIAFLQSRQVALHGEDFVSAAALYVAAYGDPQVIHDATAGHEVIGYVCEEPIDVRVGGPLQARYYLSQFALAPLLLELETTESSHEFVLANFQTASALGAFLRKESRRIVVSINETVALTARGHVP